MQNLKELEEDVRWYSPALRKEFFNVKVFLVWVGAAILQGAFLPVAGFSAFGMDKDHLWLTGTGIFFWVVLCVNLALLRRLTLAIPFTVAITLGCVVCFPILVFALDLWNSPQLHGVFEPLFGITSIEFLLATCCVVVVFLALGEPLITYVTPGGPPAEGSQKMKLLPSTVRGEP